MPTRSVVSAKRLKTQTLRHIDDCPTCAFGGKTEGSLEWPSAFRREKGASTGPFLQGDWKKAVFLRPGVAAAPEGSGLVAQRNVNDFLKHVPCGVLAKGTEFFHVTKSADWVKRSQVGGARDYYSFFTLRAKGFASTHANDFKARIQLRLKTDLHVFFFSSYALDLWRPFEMNFALGKKQMQVAKFGTNVGGEVISAVLGSWPEQYRPVAWVGCSECEIVIHNSIVPHVLETTAIATSSNSFDSKQPRDTKIVHISELPASRPDASVQVGLDGRNGPPRWMSPSKYSDAKIKAIEKAMVDARGIEGPGWAGAVSLFED